MFLKKYKLYPVILFSLFSFPQLMHAQTDSLFLTVDQLFERGVQYSLQLQADAMKESMAQERTRTARTARLPELQIGLKGGFVGQPVVWERDCPHLSTRTRRTGHKIMRLIWHNLSIRAVKSEVLSIRRILKSKSPNCRL